MTTKTRAAQPGERLDEEVYLYHAPENLAGELSPTHPHSRAPPATPPARAQRESSTESWNAASPGGETVWAPAAWIAASVPGWTTYARSDALYQPRYLSDKGRLFFDCERRAGPRGRQRHSGRLRVRARRHQESRRQAGVLGKHLLGQRRLRVRPRIRKRSRRRISRRLRAAGRRLPRADQLRHIQRRIGVPRRLASRAATCSSSRHRSSPRRTTTRASTSTTPTNARRSRRALPRSPPNRHHARPKPPAKRLRPPSRKSSAPPRAQRSTVRESCAPAARETGREEEGRQVQARVCQE